MQSAAKKKSSATTIERVANHSNGVLQVRWSGFAGGIKNEIAVVR